MVNEYVRQATETDGADILRIYGQYISMTAVTFETELPSLSDFEARVKSISEQYPYLLYFVDDKIIGFAYASSFRERHAYRFSVETSIYLDMNFRGRGIGTKLYKKLLNILRSQGYYTAYSGITVPNEHSLNLHKKLGFTEVGVFSNAGYKLGSWRDVRWLQLQLREHDSNPKDPSSTKSLPLTVYDL